MSKRGKKLLSILLEVIGLSILTVGIYWGAMMLIFAFPYSQLFPYIFLISIIAFDFIYICTVKFWPLKNIHIKIIVGLLLFACSAALATSYIMPLNFGF
jgi:ABC-type transport system involved in Fe-S cluster assembly fused permease/ATPase subunit